MECRRSLNGWRSGMQKLRLTGLVAAAHTPFQADGTLNLPVVEKQVEHFLKNGPHTVFITGTTGESHSLTLEERLALTQRWMEVVRGTDLRVIVHVGSNCLGEARQLAAQASRLGALAFAALSPCYFKPRTLEDLIACCADIASVAPELPFYYYDIPALTGVSMPMPEFLLRARDRIPNLVGLKFTNSDLMQYQQCLHLEGGAFDILWGNDEFLLAALAVGAQGAVGSSYCFAARIYERLIRYAQEGNLAAARTEQLRSVHLIKTLIGYGYMGAAKTVMAFLGVDVGPARLPNTNLSAAQRTALHADLESLGFFDWLI